jgi:hypothetical protein
VQAHHPARAPPDLLHRRAHRDMQIAMRHADPRTTGLYDMAKNNKDRHASHRVASFLAGMTG